MPWTVMHGKAQRSLVCRRLKEIRLGELLGDFQCWTY